MDIVISQKQAGVPVTIFRVRERINLGNAEELVQKAQEAFAGGMRHLILDLSEVDSITSAGLRAIHRIYKLLEVKPASGEAVGGCSSSYLKLVNPTPEVRRTMNIVGFDTFMDILDTEQAALAAFG